MRIIDFYGVVPKTHGTKLQLPFAQKAINVDLYGGKLQGLPAPEKGWRQRQPFLLARPCSADWPSRTTMSD